MQPFTVTPQNRPFLFAKIERLDPTRQWEVIIREKKSQRSNQQNRWMRGLAKDLGAYLGYSEDQMYEIIMYTFCPEFISLPDGSEVRMPGHFSKKPDGTKRTTKEAAEIQEATIQWAATLGFVWSEEAA